MAAPDVEIDDGKGTQLASLSVDVRKQRLSV